jgi:hypothetical protein
MLWALQPFGVILDASPSNYRALLRTLQPGDTLNLAPGVYPRLPIRNLNGEPDAWITITGPASGQPAVIAGEEDQDTVDILNSSYVSIENLRIDSRGFPGAFGISTKGKEENVTHHIRVQGNVLVGQGGSQQTDGISTKSPTWGWVIRFNQIIGAGTGMYLGNSDGTQPFLQGVIENNLIRDTIGYNLEIKHQVALPDMPGMPTGPGTTIIRNNVFIKNDQPSPDGDRPNVLLDSFPQTGSSALSMYQVYGNYFIHNHREALLQVTGRVSIHDNVFIDGPGTFAAIFVTPHEGAPVKVAYLYNNTIFSTYKGIQFRARALIDDAVVGNLIFSSTPVVGPVMRQTGNLTDLPENAPKYVAVASDEITKMDFFPLPGKCLGAPLDLSLFASDTDFSRDFNGDSKIHDKGAVVFRGAYSAEGANSAWKPRDGLKPPLPPRAVRLPELIWMTPSSGRPGSVVNLELTGSDFETGDQVEVSGTGLSIQNIEVSPPSRIKAVVKVSRGLTVAPRDVVVSAPSGKSNPLRFRIAGAATNH